MERKRIYFMCLNGRYVTNRDVAEAYYLISGKKVSSQDLEIIKKIAENDCEGISHYVDNVTVDDLVCAGDEVLAIQLLSETKNISILEAKKEVDKIKKELQLQNK